MQTLFPSRSEASTVILILLLLGYPLSCQPQAVSPFAGLAGLADLQQQSAYTPWHGLSNVEDWAGASSQSNPKAGTSSQSNPKAGTSSQSNPSPSPGPILDRRPLLTRAFSAFGSGGQSSVTDLFQSSTDGSNGQGTGDKNFEISNI